MTAEEKLFRIILLGDSGVGKDSIVKRFNNNIFDDNNSSTVGINFSIREMIVNKKDKIKLKLIDTCGQEKYRSLSKAYLKNTDAVLFVFSMNDKDSFYSITEWIKLLDEYNCKENIIKYLVGNNNDLKSEIEGNLIDKFSQENNIPYIKISSRSIIDVDNLFEDLGKKLY